MILSWLYNTFSGRVISSLVIAILVYLLVRFIVPLVTRKTAYEIDDIIVGSLRIPLPIIVFLTIVVFSLSLTDWPERLTSILTKVYYVLVILILAFIALKLCTGIIARWATHHAKETESNLDDVLTPLLTKRVIPLFILIIAIATILWILGVNLSSVLTVLGAVSFLLIFLFQEPLSNLFGGVYLVMDVPFKYGDLIILEDDKTYRVDDIGSRVSKLYNTSDHTIAYIPNNKLAGQRIINLTRPNVELRMRMPIGVAYGTSDFKVVQNLLKDVANAHPHVLGDADTKLKAMENKLKETSEINDKLRFSIEMERITVESNIRNMGEQLIRRLRFLAQFVHSIERGGLCTPERNVISNFFESIWPSIADIRRQYTIWVHLVGRLDAAYNYSGSILQLKASELDQSLPSINQLEEWRRNQPKTEQIIGQLLNNNSLVVLGTLRDVDEEFYLAGSTPWMNFSREVKSLGVKANICKSIDTWIQEQPAWTTFRDYYTLYENRHKPIRDLMNHLESCQKIACNNSAKEFTLDDAIENVVNLIEEKFFLKIPGWQMPDADFTGFGASSIDFQLEFFVDDLVREHFERISDVFSELGIEIIRVFRLNGIEIPFPQTDVWFRDNWLKGSFGKLK